MNMFRGKPLKEMTTEELLSVIDFMRREKEMIIKQNEHERIILNTGKRQVFRSKIFFSFLVIFFSFLVILIR